MLKNNQNDPNGDYQRILNRLDEITPAPQFNTKETTAMWGMVKTGEARQLTDSEKELFHNVGNAINQVNAFTLLQAKQGEITGPIHLMPQLAPEVKVENIRPKNPESNSTYTISNKN